jgi:flavorubredoxin
VVTLDGVVELVPGRLFRLGTAVEAAGDIAWLPAGRRGCEALNVYLLLAGGAAVLVDTGVAAQRDGLLAQLAALHPADQPLDIVLTRSEPDCIGNLGALMASRRVGAVFAGGGANNINPFDYFDQVAADAGAASPLVRKDNGDGIDVGESRRLTFIRPGVRILSTSWAYDDGTGTLFSSDLFGHLGLAAAGDEPVARSLPEPGDRALLRDHVTTKFDWLVNADLARVRRDLAGVFEARRVARIAPTHGRVLEGEAVVTAHLGLLMDVLAELDSEAARR